MTNDAVLLRQYLDGSELAFAELVRLHIGAVHGTALRMVGGDAHLANDVTQKVFTGLARKASTLVDRPVLLGWLYLSTHYEAAATVRAERRWRNREQKAHAMQEIENQGSPEPDWTALRPVIDAALLDLKEGDRDALLLRFFHSQTFAEVGESLGLSENAARMRVDRAVDKLRDVLTNRGIKSTAVALGTVIATQLATAAPGALAATVTTAALAGAASTSAAAIIFMGMTKLQWGVAAALAVTGGSVVWSEHQTALRLQTENAALVQQTAEVSRLKMENAALEANARRIQSLQQEASATEALRAEETQLRKDIDKAVAARNARFGGAPRSDMSLLPQLPTKPSTTVDGQPIYRLRDLDERPMPVDTPEPELPTELKIAGAEGSVLVSCVVGPDGLTHELAIEQASNNALAEVAKKALAKWKFKPAIKAGAPVNSRVIIPFKLGLNYQTLEEWL